MLEHRAAAEFVARARDHSPCLGIHHSAMSVQLVEMYGQLGLDFVIIGGEVESLDWGTMESLVRACDASGTASIAKIRSNDSGLIGRALDLGAAFVTVPHMTSREQLDAAVRDARFAPLGTRGVCPVARYNFYGARELAEVIAATNQRRPVIPIIEDAEALHRLDDLVSCHRHRHRGGGTLRLVPVAGSRHRAGLRPSGDTVRTHPDRRCRPKARQGSARPVVDVRGGSVTGRDDRATTGSLDSTGNHALLRHRDDDLGQSTA